jgi:hypothetical protein
MQVAMMRRVVMARLMRHSAPPIKPRAARGPGSGIHQGFQRVNGGPLFFAKSMR